MDTLELKKKLINEVNLVKDRDLLEELYSFLNLGNKLEKIYQLNIEQKNAIDEARKQVDNGDYLTNDDANSEIDKWLGK
ncbi:MAG: hypothetical protein ABIP95_16395 [Pelobium sp.]